MPNQEMFVDAGRLHPVTEQGRGTRNAVMKAALRQFSKHGYLDAKVEDIVADAGVAYGTFYKYFHSKRDLVRAILTDVYDDIARRRMAHIEAAPRPILERAYPDVLATLRAFYIHRETLRVLDVALGADQELAHYVRHLETGFTNASIGILESLRTPFDPYLASLAINACVDEAARRWIRSDELTGDPEQDDIRLRELARTIAAMCVAVIAPSALDGLVSGANQATAS